MTAILHLRNLPIWALRLAIIWIETALLFVSGIPAVANAEPTSAKPLDLIFVIDNSGSMRKNDPEFITPKVVDTFVRGLPLEARVGMVVFDQTARLIKPLAPVVTAEEKGAFVADLDQIDYKGQFTNSAVGIERALYELKDKGRPEAQKGIIFITDGIVDTGDAKKDEALNQWLKQDLTAESRALGVRIFGIAFSEAADFVLIQALAARTQAEYYRAYQASGISQILDNILNLLSPEIPEPQTAPPAPSGQEQPQEEVAPQATQVLPAPEPEAQNITNPWKRWLLKFDAASDQFLSIVLAVAITAITLLVIALILLYIKQMGALRKGLPNTVPPQTIPPDACLEDLNERTVDGNNLLEISKEHITIGRDPRNDLVIDKPTISSFHATIEYRNMMFFLEDQRSTNGTKVNDEKLESNKPVRLKNGDRISFAAFQYKFVIPNQIPFGETAMVAMTVMAEESGSTVVIDLDNVESSHDLVGCMQNHLLQLHAMGPKYKEFIAKYFPYDMLEILAIKAHEGLLKTESDGNLYCEPVQQNNAFYLVCSLPVPVSAAADWYGVHYNGFTQFLLKWIKSEKYKSTQSDRMCVVTFGQDPATWVSLTIVPTREDEEDPVEIMSVDFLNDAEKAMLSLNFDHSGRLVQPPSE